MPSGQKPNDVIPRPNPAPPGTPPPPSGSGGGCAGSGCASSGPFGMTYPTTHYQGPSPSPLSQLVIAPIRFNQNSGATPYYPPPRPGNTPGGLAGFPKAGGINNS